VYTVFPKTQTPPQRSRHKKVYTLRMQKSCQAPTGPQGLCSPASYQSNTTKVQHSQNPFLWTGISEWPSSRNVLPQVQNFCLTLQSVMGISLITWLQTQVIKGLIFHSNNRANSLDEAQKDQSRELFYVRQQSYGRGWGGGMNRENLQIQINSSSFQITISYREGCKNIKTKACRICSSITMWLVYDKMGIIRGTSKQWRAEGGLLGGSTPPKFRRPSKIVPDSTQLWKMLKIAEFRTPTPQVVRKKDSKILKLPRFAIFFTLAMTNKLVVIINSLKVPKIKKILL